MHSARFGKLEKVDQRGIEINCLDGVEASAAYVAAL